MNMCNNKKVMVLCPFSSIQQGSVVCCRQPLEGSEEACASVSGAHVIQVHVKVFRPVTNAATLTAVR